MPVSLDLITSNTGLLTLQKAAHAAVTSLNSSVTAVTLYSHGCDFADAQGHFTSNCTEACRDPIAVWDSMFTLHNCLSYSTVSVLLSKGDLSEGDREKALAMGYMDNVNLTMMTEPIDTCMHSFCREISTSGGCYAHELHEICHGGDSSSRTVCNRGLEMLIKIQQFDPEEFIKGACGYFKASPNTDVGGVGVFVGYLMQLSILIYCYIHTRLLATWIRAGTFAIHAPWRGAKVARQKAAEVQERLKKTHQQAALISGLVEFQRSQSFYSITLQAAAVASLAGTGSVFDVESYDQMHLTVSLLGDVATAGIVCIAFGLYILHGWNKRSWYTSLLSWIAILVSFAAWLLTRLPLENLRALTPTERNLPSCGGRSPATYCLSNQAKLNTPVESTLIGICLATMVLLMFRQWRAHVTKSPVKQRPWRVEIAEAVFAGITILMMYLLISNGEMEAMREGTGVQWTFAQLISVTIWAPCIVEYLYAAVRKWSLGANSELQALFADEDSDADD